MLGRVEIIGALGRSESYRVPTMAGFVVQPVFTRTIAGIVGSRFRGNDGRVGRS